MTEKSFEQHLTEMRARPIEDILNLKELRDGSIFQKAAMKVYQEIEDEKKNKRHQELLAVTQKRAERHDLITFWRLSDWPERFGIISIYSGVFVFGYLCAKMSFASQLIDLIRQVIP